MGVDVSTYRARIGCFSNRSKQRLHHLPPERLNLSCFGSLGFFKLFAVATVVLVLLSTSGDVESNPGPLTGAEKLDKLQHAIEALTTSSARYQQESSQKLDAINTGIAGLGLRVTSLEAKINEITTVKENVAQLTQELSDVKRESAGVYRHLNVLTETLDDMNNRMRRNNLILKGLPEGEHESWSDTEQLVSNFIRENITQNLGDIERAHRLGQKRTGSTRPVIVKFLSFKSKDEVLRHAYKLKNVPSPKVWISEDFSPNVQFARQRLWEFASQFREQNIRYKLSYDKLRVGNQTYVYNNESAGVVQLQAPQRESARPPE